MKAYDLELMTVLLTRVRDLASVSPPDPYFISELNHLLATVNANKETT